MKKYLLLHALCIMFMCSYAQPILNEMYITPGSSLCNGTARQEFFEIYNGNQGNGNAVSNLGCYYLVTRWETGGGGIGNEGFYVVDLPSNATTNSAGFYTASAANVFGTQTGSGNPCQFTATHNWNSGITKKYTLAAGNTYTSATITNLFNLFDETLSQVTVLLYNGNSVVDAFVGGGGGNINNILARIHAWAPLTLSIDCAGSTQSNTITFGNITATDIDAVNQAAGTDNGFIRKYDGNCAPWDKSSSPPFHTPGSPNNGGLIPTTEPFWTSTFSDFVCQPGQGGTTTTTNDTLKNIRNVTSVTYYVYRDINNNGTYDLGLDPLFGTAHPINLPANATSYVITGIELPVGQTSFVLVRMSNGSNCFYTQNIFTTSCVITPIAVSNFSAIRKGNTAVLNWQTQTEINAKSFDVEILSGNTYTKVASVAATNNPAGSSYAYVDNNTAKSTSLYRLKLVDIDNSFRYSEVRSIKGLAAVSDFTIYPNPSTGSAKVMINDVTDGTQVQLMDNTGRILKNITLQNSNTATLNGLQRGVYLVKVINVLTNESVVKKLTVN
jgi:Secretion system C-terminal sorting domain